MTFRSDRAQQVIAAIDANIAAWDQNVIFHKVTPCGTTHCFAGFAQMLAGKADQSILCQTYDEAPWNDAKEYLGLSEDQAEYAFDSSRTLEQLRRFAITGEIYSDDDDDWGTDDDDCTDDGTDRP